MSDEPASVPDLNSLEIDLAASFLPSWAKETDPHARLAGLAARGGDDDSARGTRGRSGRERESRGRPGQNRSERRDGGERRSGPDRRGRGSGSGREDAGRRGPGGRRPQRPDVPVQEPLLEGWNLQFLPEPHGIEGIARQMKADLKAYPLFDLAWLVLEKPDRYRVEFRRKDASSPQLFQVKMDGSLWLSERDAVAHVLARHLDQYYRRESVPVDPPKGAFPFVAVCGMSGTVLGPPNYHDYQAKLLRLFTERFAHLPFELYKNRIRMERDEALIQQWKDSQSTRDEFHPLNPPEGAEPQKWVSIIEVEQDFRERHLKTAVVVIREKAWVSGKVALETSAALVVQRVRRFLEELRRFPLPLAHTMGRQLTSKGLHLFKAHQKITYVSVARPKYLDRETMPVAEGVRAMLEYLEAHTKTPRPEQWKALVALRRSESMTTDAEAESVMVPDLLWLLREGHVIDFARKGFEVARKPHPQPPSSKKAAVAPDAGAAMPGSVPDQPEDPIAGMETGAENGAEGVESGTAAEGLPSGNSACVDGETPESDQK